MNDSARLLKLIMFMIALHSFCVGLALIFFPPELMQHFGFNQFHERFFTAQGGVLHLVMSVSYVMAALKLEETTVLIFFSVIAKFMATVFLFTYYFMIQGVWSVLFSGVGDGMMGCVILWAYLKYSKDRAEVLIRISD